MKLYKTLGRVSQGSFLIFKGSFGKVQKVKRLSDNKLLVWKEMNYGIMSEKEK